MDSRWFHVQTKTSKKIVTPVYSHTLLQLHMWARAHKCARTIAVGLFDNLSFLEANFEPI